MEKHKIRSSLPIKLKMKTPDQSFYIGINRNNQLGEVNCLTIGHIIEQNQKLTELIEQQNQKIGEQNQKIGELIEKQNQLIKNPSHAINNNNLQLICVESNDSYCGIY